MSGTNMMPKRQVTRSKWRSWKLIASPGPAEENPLFGTMIRPFLKYVEVPKPEPDSPHILRFADETKLARTLSEAGFHAVNATKHKIDLPWPGTPEEAWEGGSELAAPFGKIMAA